MTLVVGIIAKNGIVLAADSRMSAQITSNDNIQKVFKLNDHNAVGMSGDGTIGIHFLEVIAVMLTFEKGIVDLVEQIRKLGKEQFEEYFSHQQPKERPGLTFLIAGYTKDGDPRIYQLSSNDNFVPRPSSTGFNCIGVPYFADYLLNRFYQSEISMTQAQVLAAFCIKETESQSHQVGGEIKIAAFSDKNSYSELPQITVAKIQEQCSNFHILNKNKFYPEDISEETSEDNSPTTDATKKPPNL